MEKNSWTDCVIKDEVQVLQRVKQDRNILHTIKGGRLTGLVTSCIGTVYYNTLLKETLKLCSKVRNISSTAPIWEDGYDLGVVSLELCSRSVPWVQCQHFLEKPTNAI